MAIGKSLALLGGVVSVIAILTAPWDKIIPTTREKHDHDVETALQSVQEFRDEWKCDEWTEELSDILSITDPTPLDLQRIRVIRAKMDNRGCERFDLE